MYKVSLKENGRYNEIAFVFKEYDEASDFCCLAMNRSIEDVEVTISKVAEEEV